jgi:DNA-binding MarR family transcriptional regulator
MHPDNLIQATLAAHRRDLRGASLITLLIVLDTDLEIGTIARRIGVSHAAMTGIADRLTAKEYIERVPSNLDRRKLKLKITPKGIATIEAILNQ